MGEILMTLDTDTDSRLLERVYQQDFDTTALHQDLYYADSDTK